MHGQAVFVACRGCARAAFAVTRGTPRLTARCVWCCIMHAGRHQLTHHGDDPPPAAAAAAPPANAGHTPAPDRTATMRARGAAAAHAPHAGTHKQRPLRPAAAAAAGGGSGGGGASHPPAKAVLQQQIERLIATGTQPPPPAVGGAAQQPLRTASWGGGATLPAPGTLRPVTGRAAPPRSPSAPGLASSARHPPSGPAAAISNAVEHSPAGSGTTHPPEAAAVASQTTPAAAAATEENVGAWLHRAWLLLEKLTGGLMAAGAAVRQLRIRCHACCPCMLPADSAAPAACVLLPGPDGSLQALTARRQLVQGILANLPAPGGAAAAGDAARARPQPQDGKQARLM
jgi:hypothetical protein